MSERESERNAVNVRVDGEDAILHITDQSVMFERGGRVSGFERSAIRMVKPDGDAMIIAYSAGSEVKSVRVEPMRAVVALLALGLRTSTVPTTSQSLATAAELDKVFKRLYVETRRELEEKLAKVQEAPENMSLRLTADETKKYYGIWEQMTNLVGSKYGFDPWVPENTLGFLGLENEPYERQVDTIKTLHVFYLIDLAGPKAETADVRYAIDDVWPEDMERVLIRFGLADQPFLTGKFKSYLKSKWTRQKGNKTPPLVRS